VTPLEAARLLLADYADRLLPVDRISLSGVQAAIVDQATGARVLAIRGTNELTDWLRYNFQCLPEVDQGDQFQWHRGFLHYAQIAYAFAKGKGVQLVVGHSLGAAAAGIVATSLGVPAIAFATPRALFGGLGPDNESIVRNFLRIDDLVCMLPPGAIGFRHVGEVNWLRTQGRHIGQDHTLIHYLELLEDVT
jgi:hypothetical protein